LYKVKIRKNTNEMEGKRKSQKEVKKVPTVKISLLSHNRVGKKNDEFANWKK
jgi:hypothetical protein